MRKGKSYQAAYEYSLKEELRKRAEALLRKYAPGGPPHDPYLIAEKLSVEVQETDLPGHYDRIDGPIHSQTLYASS